LAGIDNTIGFISRIAVTLKFARSFEGAMNQKRERMPWMT
jgi:hypothetical protein